MDVISRESLGKAVDFLLGDGLVAFPTDTVYGLGGNAYSDKAVSEIFLCKNRPQFNPINVCYASFEEAEKDVEVTDIARKFTSKFLPGAVTLILKRKKDSKLSWLCSAGKDTIGIRVPNNPIALELLRKLNFPLAAPSANRSCELSTTTAEAVCESLQSCHNLMVIDGGISNFGIESTIIDLSQGVVKILRKGVITVEEIGTECGVTPIIWTKSAVKHYYPKNPVVMNVEKVEDTDALLAFGLPLEGAKYCLNLSPSGDLLEAGQNFFKMLRQLDNTDAARICVMPIPKKGIGQAINERLHRSL